MQGNPNTMVKKVWMPNGPIFKCHSNTIHCFPLFKWCPVFECPKTSGIQMLSIQIATVCCKISKTYFHDVFSLFVNVFKCDSITCAISTNCCTKTILFCLIGLPIFLNCIALGHDGKIKMILYKQGCICVTAGFKSQENVHFGMTEWMGKGGGLKFVSSWWDIMHTPRQPSIYLYT